MIIVFLSKYCFLLIIILINIINNIFTCIHLKIHLHNDLNLGMYILLNHFTEFMV